MKQLLYITFIISSLTGFSQEKGPICSGGASLSHPIGSNSYIDYIRFSSGALNLITFGGAFQVDSITTDSLIYEITLFSGDSLVYGAGWYNDGGPCYIAALEPEDTDSVVTILEGTPFPVTIFEPSGYGVFNFAISQKGIVRNSCLIQIKADYLSNPKKTLVRVTFVDPPLGISEISNNDMSISLTDENTLFIKTNENGSLNAKIYALSGQLVNETIIEGSQNLDISAFTKGYYILHVIDENGRENQLKFVK